MFTPEYAISNKTLNNIAQIESARAIIADKTILPHWEKQLQKEAMLNSIVAGLKYYNVGVDPEKIKRYLDSLGSAVSIEVKNLVKALEYIESLIPSRELHEEDIKNLHFIISNGLTAPGIYRKRSILDATKPDEILVEMVEMMDWYNGLDAKETHPVIVAAIIKAKMELTIPFDQTNYLVSNLTARLILKSTGYYANGYLNLEHHFSSSTQEYLERLSTIIRDDEEYTEWLEYFTEGLAIEMSNIKETVLLLARDSKVAKASGRIKLSARQERVIEYLQDYGILQNKDFARVFPNISEDTVLRDLKTLIDKGIVVKNGSTKSSRYELVG